MPYVQQITFWTKQGFVYLNMLYCSFFVLSIIQFWNLTLIYNFLTIQTVPKFVQAFFSKMINFFFTFNSFSSFVNHITNKTIKNQNLVDFSILSQTEKVGLVKNDHAWFGFPGFSSNFMVNNFDSLVLLSLFLLKSFLIKFILKILR